MTPSPYERAALEAIQDWRTRPPGQVERVYLRARAATRRFSSQALKTLRVEAPLERALSRVTRLAQDSTRWMLSEQAALDALSRHAPGVERREDIAHLDLQAVDAATRDLAKRHKVSAGLSGALAGSVGFTGLLADVVAMLMLGLRAVGEYATYHGFDLSDEAEQALVIEVLRKAGGSNDGLTPLAQLARGSTLGGEQGLRALGMELTRARTSRLLPLIGAGAGAALNTAHLTRVCDVARNLYRERFLTRKYGAEVVEAIQAGAADKDKHPGADEGEGEEVVVDDASGNPKKHGNGAAHFADGASAHLAPGSLNHPSAAPPQADADSAGGLPEETAAGASPPPPDDDDDEAR